MKLLSDTCVYPGCKEKHERDVWCHKHWGYYPHRCEDDRCMRTVQFDDEPMCYTHSPDEGSSKKGYSAYKKAFGITDG